MPFSDPLGKMHRQPSLAEAARAGDEAKVTLSNYAPRIGLRFGISNAANSDDNNSALSIKPDNYRISDETADRFNAMIGVFMRRVTAGSVLAPPLLGFWFSGR